MILKHEKKINEGREGEAIVLVGIVSSRAQAIMNRVAGKNYIHYCYHDETPLSPCTREEI